MAGVVAFLFGLIIGSFLNVCIVRIPAGKSVVMPASACPKCSAPIRPWDNIPVLSWILLGGKCRSCKTRISAIYPLVELLTGGLFLACYAAFGLTLMAAKAAVFAAMMVVLAFTDLRDRILPDAVNYLGFASGLAFSLFTPPADRIVPWLARRAFDYPLPTPALSFASALLGAAVGSGLLWLVMEGYFRLRHREGMGLGDIKMMLLAGAFLGPEHVLLTILAGSLLGSIVGIAFILLWRKGSQYELPFGTFLAMAGLLVMFFGTPLLHWYQSLLAPG